MFDFFNNEFVPIVFLGLCVLPLILILLWDKIDKFYKKYILPLINKKIKKTMYFANNFLRPYRYVSNKRNSADKLKVERLVFANEFCVLKIMHLYKELYYCDKVTGRVFYMSTKSINIDTMIDNLCVKFDFTTKFEDLLNIIRSYSPDFEKFSDELYGKPKEKHLEMCINDMSIAELITLPGINMGKANKLMKHIKKTPFKSLRAFLNIAKLPKNNEEKIIELFDGKTNCIPKIKEILPE